jgi:hypothetical protein
VDSVIVVAFWTVKSQLAWPDALSCESALGSLPKANEPVGVKQLVLNHLLVLPARGIALPGSVLAQPAV